jgi:hypothetical protein
MFKIQKQEENGLWHDVRDAEGNLMTFGSRGSAQERLAELFPVLVGMEKYGGQDRTRVIAIYDDKDDEDKGRPGDPHKERPQR